jgi:hypothetical protein
LHIKLYDFLSNESKYTIAPLAHARLTALFVQTLPVALCRGHARQVPSSDIRDL